MTRLLRLSLCASLLVLSACGDKEGDDAGSADGADGGEVDAASSCTSLCESSGFDAGTADEYEHEVNCTCSGGDGSGSIAAEDCTSMCTDLGWSSGEAYAAEACQCS